MNREYHKNCLIQAQLHQQGFYNGRLDGLWGQGTENAFAKYVKENERPTLMSAKARIWPKDTQEALTKFYGPPGEEYLVTIPLPYPMRIAWDTGATVKTIRCHTLVAESLTRILTAIKDHYGSIDAIRAARMDLYGGCYNYRKMRNGDSWSRHSWGIAIDLDPDQNGLNDSWPKPATMPERVIEIFEKEGWLSGARQWGRDAMHFQATS